MSRKKKKNWELLRERDLKDTTQFRDVYEDQQLERSEIGHKKSFKSRMILNIILTVLVFFGLYFFTSVLMFLGGAFNQWVGRAADDTVNVGSTVEAQPTPGVEEQESGIKRIDEAPEDISIEVFLEEYFVPVDGSGSIQKYEDAEGNIYTLPDIKQLHGRVQAGEMLSEREQLLREIKRLQAENDGPLPLSMAPKNISRDAFRELYFRRGSTALVAFWYDSEGNKYKDVEVDIYWEKVIKGEAGSGKNSDIPELGGSGWDDMHESESGDKVVNGVIVRSLGDYLRHPSFKQVLLCLALSGLFFLFMFIYMKKNLSAQNLLEDTTDINQYPNDQHIALPEEIQQKFDWFPDVGAHCPVQVNSMISHMGLLNKGLHSVAVTRRAAKDIIGKDGDIELYKGEVVVDDNDEPIRDILPMIDEKFMDELFTASGMPKDKKLRKRYDPSKIDYNPGDQNRDKLRGAETLADMINKYWVMPEYEPQRPGGAYLVDTQPVNTMV